MILVRKRNRKGNYDDSEFCEKEKNDFGSKEKSYIDIKLFVCVEIEELSIFVIKEVKVLFFICIRISIIIVEYNFYCVWGGSVSFFYEII